MKHTVADGLRFSLRPSDLRAPTFRALSALQDCRPHVQIGALLLAACLWCSLVGVCPHEELARIRRMAADAERNNELIRALADYIRGEHGDLL